MDVIQAIRERCSINFFEPGRDISAQTLRDLLELANLAPSSMNLQPWRVIVMNEPERKKTLRRCAFDQPKVEEASAVLILIADLQSVDRIIPMLIAVGYLKAGITLLPRAYRRNFEDFVTMNWYR